jgi:hypothetical protein
MSATLSLQQRWGQKVGRERGEDFKKKKTVNRGAVAELELFVRGVIINIIKYNIYFTLLYMIYKKNLYNLVLFK